MCAGYFGIFHGAAWHNIRLLLFSHSHCFLPSAFSFSSLAFGVAWPFGRHAFFWLSQEHGVGAGIVGLSPALACVVFFQTTPADLSACWEWMWLRYSFSNTMRL